MDLNNRIAYLQRLGDKTEIKDVINNNILIRIESNIEMDIFIRNAEKYALDNNFKLSLNLLLSNSSYPTQIRFIKTPLKNSYGVLIFGAISNMLLESMFKEKKAVNSNKIHFEESFEQGEI